MPSFTTSYACSSCHVSTKVEVLDLGDPYRHVSGNTGEAMRRIRNLQGKPGDPVEEIAQEILEQEAQMVLRYATCPACSAKNPAGLEVSRAERKSSLLFGGIFLGGLAVAAYFYPWIALIFPVLNLAIIRPLAVVNARKMRDKPFPTGMFILSILLDISTIVVVLHFPRLAPVVPLLGIVQSLFGGSAKDQWRWDDTSKKLRFEANAPTTA